MASSIFHKNFTRALLVACAFLCMQVAAVTHAATFGDADHSHNGTPCAIQLLSDGPTAPATDTTSLLSFDSSAPVFGPARAYVASEYLDYSRAIRAPPTLSS